MSVIVARFSIVFRCRTNWHIVVQQPAGRCRPIRAQQGGTTVGRTSGFVSAFRVAEGRRFRLKHVDPGDAAGLKSKEAASALLEKGIAQLAGLQEKLFADDRWSVLVVLQAMDAAGKDGTIKHVMSGVNPQGVQVVSFKAPSAEELDHDFLWRSLKALPERGRIGIFNRSYYEEVLVVRVHGELLAAQKLPAPLATRRLWQERFESINDVERHLARNGTIVLKFFLHVSKAEQRRRLLSRLEDREKHWKFSPTDLAERERWHEYMAAYEEMIRATATPQAPWHVIPADNKWFARLAVAATIVDALQGLDLAYPTPDPEMRKRIATARAALTAGTGGTKARPSPRRRTS
jgi:PPK2 family polyphosphate:nucleotide phosphotransferase